MNSLDALKHLQPKKILLIKPSAIGDVVHSLPILNLIRRRWPAAHIAWMLTPQCAGLLEGHPQLDEIILFQRRQLGRGWWNLQATAGLWKFTAALRHANFDLVVDLQGLFRSGYFAWASRAPVRVGFAAAREGGRWFYTHRISGAAGEHRANRHGGRHAVERYLDIAEAMGCGRSPVEFPLPIGEAEKKRVAEKLGPFTPYALLLPGSIWPTKRWPATHFAALGNILRQKHGLKIVAAGSPDERVLAEQVQADVNLVGQTNLRELLALIAGAKVVIANDSGPMHIAAALQRPLITPFGPTNPALTGPYRRPESVVQLDIPCSPCYSRSCAHQSCLQLLPPDAIMRTLQAQMSG